MKCNGTFLSVSDNTVDVNQLEACQAYTANVKAKTEAGLGEGEQIDVYTAVKGLLPMQ